VAGELGALHVPPVDLLDGELAATIDPPRVAVGGRRPRSQLAVVALLEHAWARADQRVARAQLAADTRLDRLVEDACLRQPPEQVASEQALRQRRLARTDREHDLVCRRQLLRDLETGVPATHHEHGFRRHAVRAAVAGRMRLKDTGSELIGELEDVGRLKGTAATTTWPAVIVRSAGSRLKRPSPVPPRRPLLFGSIGRSNVSAYRSRYAITTSRPG